MKTRSANFTTSFVSVCLNRGYQLEVFASEVLQLHLELHLVAGVHASEGVPVAEAGRFLRSANSHNEQSLQNRISLGVKPGGDNL